MSYYKDEFLKELKERKERKERGEFNGIPFCYEGYRDYMESIDRGVYMGLASGPGNGKSFWVRYTGIFKPLEFAFETGYLLKILYFALEDSKMQVYKSICAYYLWVRHNIYIPKKILDSKTEPLPDRYMEILMNDTEFFEQFENSVIIVDDVSDADGILKVAQDYYDKFGPDYHFIMIIDNYANVEEDGYKSKYEAVATLSRKHIRKYLCKVLGFSVIAVIQNDMDSEKFAARNNSGNIASIEPNLGSFGDIKIITRDMHVIWALFNPWKYQIPIYPHPKAGWNTECLRDKFRALLMLKNNLDAMAPRFGLFFDGAKGIFTELPKVTEEDKLQRIYAQVIEDERKIKQSRSQKH